MKQLLNDEEAAEYLGISVQTLRKLVKDRELETVGIEMDEDARLRSATPVDITRYFMVDNLEKYVGRRLRQLKRAARDDENWNKK